MFRRRFVAVFGLASAFQHVNAQSQGAGSAFSGSDTLLQAISTRAELPPGTFLENLVVDDRGSIFVTSFEEGRVYRLLPGKRIERFADVRGKVAGIAIDGNGAIVLTGIRGDGAQVLTTLSQNGSVLREVVVPGAVFLNGIVRYRGSSFFVADSYAGKIWTYNATTGVVGTLVSDTVLARANASNPFPGVNGLRIRGDTVYASNTERKLLLRIILAGSAAPPRITVVASNVNLDDFAIATDGMIYATTHVFKSVVRVTPTGRVTVIAANDARLAGTTSLAFGRTPSDSNVMYVTTNGGLTSPTPAGPGPAYVLMIRNMPAASPAKRRQPARLSYEGEVRTQYEYVDQPVFGTRPREANGTFLTRASVLGNAIPYPGVSFRAEMRMTESSSGALTRRPIDASGIELSQLSVGLRWPLNVNEPAEPSVVDIRLGRQEIVLGSGRWLSVRDGPNVRRSFDAVRLQAHPRMLGRRLLIDALVSQPVKLRPGDFDDVRDRSRTFSAVYVTVPTSLPWELFIFHDKRDNAVYAQGAGAEQRSTVGSRLHQQRSAFSFDVEGGWQWGTFDDAPIRSWLLIGEIAHQWSHLAAKPRFTLRATRSSGDDGRTRALGTLSPMFPNGFVFTVPVGPGNLTNVHPMLALSPHRRVTMILDYDVFWRTRASDGVYDAAGALLTRSITSSARYLGQQPLLLARVAAARAWDLEMIAGRFFPGAALRGALATKDVTLFQLTSRWRV